MVTRRILNVNQEQTLKGHLRLSDSRQSKLPTKKDSLYKEEQSRREERGREEERKGREVRRGEKGKE